MTVSNSPIERFVAVCCLLSVGSISALRRLVRLLGPAGTVGLVCRKVAKKQRYEKMLRSIPKTDHVASSRANSINIPVFPTTRKEEILSRAEAMLRDHNEFFTFPYQTRDIERPWEFDPIERKYWPRRHYTENKLHENDTPRDVKIVWEINRFVDLPTLAQAGVLESDDRFMNEANLRILSWIDGNPFANSINWASGLEISIRLISWVATLNLLERVKFEITYDPKIQRSIFEQASYLAADLSTDKVIPSNHLIGEAAGLFIIASLWDYPNAKQHAQRARKILEAEIIRQTFSDGVTREASGWYHQFVTHFFDLADRVGVFSDGYRERLSRMKGYLEAMTVNGQVIRYGDADDGYALWLAGDMNAWKDAIFGPEKTHAETSSGFFPIAQQAAFSVGSSFLFLRGGEFGMGGDGSSSHAHDDFLSPIVWLNGLPVLVDPGTFVYNGDPTERAKYRNADAHNGIVIGGSTPAVQKLNFGWKKTREPALLIGLPNVNAVTGKYGEWPEHERSLEITGNAVIITDVFNPKASGLCEWRFHLDPQWKKTSDLAFENSKGDRLSISMPGELDSVQIESYDYSPSYRVSKSAIMLRVTHSQPTGTYRFQFQLQRG